MADEHPGLSRRPIYLDYNATTPVDPRVVAAMAPFLTTEFGNPSSSHEYGQPPRDALLRARRQVGLGAVLATFIDAGSSAAALCFTHGEASTLHGVQGDLAQIRVGELHAAAQVLGVHPVRLLDFADGTLTDGDV